MNPELRCFFEDLTELLRAKHGDDFMISMRDHQRKIVLHAPDGQIVLESPYMGTIPKAEKAE